MLVGKNIFTDTAAMRLPKRRSQMMRDHGPESHELTPEALERLKRTLERLQKDERPKIVVDLSHALTLGDFSENAEYQDAKAKLSRIDGRIFSLQERIRRAIVIERSGSGRVEIGSVVTVKVDDRERTYRIVGSQEADPSRGRISYHSPLGQALLNRHIGDEVKLETAGGVKNYQIITVE